MGQTMNIRDKLMQALILGDDHRQQARLAAAMMKHGFQVFCVESAAAAASYIRNELIDVLVLTETRSGRIAQSFACVDQSRNRAVSVIVMSDRTGPAIQELFEEVPQLYGVMGLDMAPGLVAALALASILPQQLAPEMQAEVPVRPATPALQTAQVVPHVGAEPVERLAPPVVRAEIVAGQGAPLARTLIEPQRRPAVPAGPRPAMIAMATAPVDQPLAATLPPKLPEIAAVARTTVALGPRWTNSSLADTSDIGSDLAALERELALVNHDRPSVLAGSIADELPRWSQPAQKNAAPNPAAPNPAAPNLAAPNLAALTDWTLGTPASTDLQPRQATALATARPDRRLELGVTLQ